MSSRRHDGMKFTSSRSLLTLWLCASMLLINRVQSDVSMKSRALKGPLDRPQLLFRVRITLESISDFFARDSSFVDSIDGI